MASQYDNLPGLIKLMYKRCFDERWAIAQRENECLQSVSSERRARGEVISSVSGEFRLIATKIDYVPKNKVLNVISKIKKEFGGVVLPFSSVEHRYNEGIFEFLMTGLG